MSRAPSRSLRLLTAYKLAILACAAIGGRAGSPFLAGTAWIAIALFQDRLLILFHEAAHGHLHPRRFWNDFLADAFCGVGFSYLVRHYRRFHLAHHRHLGDPGDDPEVEYYFQQGLRGPDSRVGVRIWLRDLLGENWVRAVAEYHAYVVRQIRAGKLSPYAPRDLAALAAGLAYLALLGVLSGRGPTGALLFWVLPQATLAHLLLKLGGYGEHGFGPEGRRSVTHSHRIGFWRELLVYPLNTNLHREHHASPRLPWYELKKRPRRVAGPAGV